MMEQKLPRFDPMMFTPDAVRQEAIAVHARLEAVQAFMQRQRAITATRQSESPALRDGRGMPDGPAS
jgi:hypothetical protein